MGDLTFLQTVWLVAVVTGWTLYLVLEGFDFGVGMLLARVRGDHVDRRVALHAIGPTWAANEIWLLVGVVGMLGAFPDWYAAWGAGFYAPIVVALLAIIVRNAGIELMSKLEDERWRRNWERAIVVASYVAPFSWGLIWSAALWGLALRGGEVAGGPLDVITPFALLGGAVTAALCRAQGAAFLALRTDGAVRDRARVELTRGAPVAAALTAAFALWTAVGRDATVVGAVALVAAAAAAVAVAAVARRPRTGVAFALTTVALVALVVGWFAALFPEGIAARDGGAGIALADAAASSYGLTMMTVIAVLLLPPLLALIGWVYWTFRQPVTRASLGEGHPSPIDALARLTGGDRTPPDGNGTAPQGPGFRWRPRRARQEPS